MRTTKGILIFLMLAVLILGTNPSAMAGRSGKSLGQGEGPFITDPHAPGTTVQGTLALYYEYVDYTCTDFEEGMQQNTNMTFFMRLEGKKNLFSFGGFAENICYWDFEAQQAEIEDFIRDEVIRELADGGIIDDSQACFAIKEVSKVVENLGDTTPVFTLMNIVIAIDKKQTCP